MPELDDLAKVGLTTVKVGGRWNGWGWFLRHPLTGLRYLIFGKPTLKGTWYMENPVSGSSKFGLETENELVTVYKRDLHVSLLGILAKTDPTIEEMKTAIKCVMLRHNYSPQYLDKWLSVKPDDRIREMFTKKFRTSE